MTKTTTAGPARPAGLDPQAVWPSRVTFAGSVTVKDGARGAVFRKSTDETPQVRVREVVQVSASEPPVATTTADVPVPQARRGRRKAKR